MPRPIPIVLILLAASTAASAQEPALETAGEWAWTTITIQDGVRVSYVFYPEADSARGGVVLRLDNRNAWPVTYGFTAVFRSDGEQAERDVAGRIEARSIVTGDEPGLFFTPFGRGIAVGEIGLRGLRVERVAGGG